MKKEKTFKYVILVIRDELNDTVIDHGGTLSYKRLSHSFFKTV